MPIVQFSKDDLLAAERLRRLQWQLHALKYERPPRPKWARECVAAFERQLYDDYFLTSGQESVLAVLDVLDQQQPF